LTLQSPTMEASHFGVESGLVDEDQLLDIPAGLLTFPVDAGGGDIRTILLGGVRRFF
jgi:hypothetical protein